MPRKKKSSWSKRATFTGVVLGLVASVPMNLLSSWLQELNIAYLVLVFLLIVAIVYSGWKLKTPDFFNNIFWLLIATVSINLFSTWVQFKVLRDTYTLPNVTILLAATVIILAIAALFQSHYLRRVGQSFRMRYYWNAKNKSLAREGKTRPVKRTTRRMPQSRSRNKAVKNLK